MNKGGYLLILLIAILMVATGCARNKKIEEPAEILPTPLELAKAAFQEGTEAYQNELYHDAVTAFNKAREYYTQAAPTSTEADSVDVNIERTQINLAVTYMGMAFDSVELNMYDDALNEYESAANIYKSLAPLTMSVQERDDNVAKLYLNMAITAKNASQFERGLGFYDKVLEYRPGDQDILMEKYTILKDNIRDEVRAYQVLKDYAEASKSYDAYIVLANAYKNNGDNNTASTYFDLALETSKTPEAYRNVADFYRSIENYSKSNQLLDQLTKIATDYATLAQAYRVMAENYGNLNNTSKKIEAYDKSLTYEKRVDVALTLANYYHSAQNWNRVINYATQVLSLESNNSSALILRGNAYAKTKNNTAAKNDLNRIVNDPVHGKTAQAILKALK